MQERIAEVRGALLQSGLPFGATAAKPQELDLYGFKFEPKDYNVYWDVRKGLIPIVGGARETGKSFFSIGKELACECESEVSWQPSTPLNLQHDLMLSTG